MNIGSNTRIGPFEVFLPSEMNAPRLRHNGEPGFPGRLFVVEGIDGSGKSTQIESLRSALHAAGLKTTLLAFWDNVVVGVKYREGFVHKVYKSERGIGAPGKPVNRRDKNVRGWHLTLAVTSFICWTPSTCAAWWREQKSRAPTW